YPRKVSQEMSELQSEVKDDDTVRFTVTLKYTYEKTGADLEKYYDTRNLRAAAEIDRKNFIEEPGFITEDITQNGRPYTVDISVARIIQGVTLPPPTARHTPHLSNSTTRTASGWLWSGTPSSTPKSSGFTMTQRSSWSME